MQEVGEILHIAGSGRVIVQLSEKVEEGQLLCDRKGTKVAKVMELIGPVRRPFASATPLTNNIKKYIGKNIFATEHSPDKKERKFRRRKR